MRYRVYLEPDEDGVFVATCPALPGCVSQGLTRIEAMDNIREAIEGYLKSLRKHGDPLPPGILEEVIEVAAGGSCQWFLAAKQSRHSKRPATNSMSNTVATSFFVAPIHRTGASPFPTTRKWPKEPFGC